MVEGEIKTKGRLFGWALTLCAGITLLVLSGTVDTTSTDYGLYIGFGIFLLLMSFCFCEINQNSNIENDNEDFERYQHRPKTINEKLSAINKKIDAIDKKIEV